ncbi:type 1 glutamine amidotransferase family protein [Ktedonobacter robiniae]|uniref:Glutamine amidotransferase n=1 Tax=Ktedonobacter robiniae TaxID=2778365 RepID=A0ABQ3UW20_9CHLR|nr:type 1 glutamine amidotransferase family protein [Ktedonobacter robiniae]GHO56874.1 glutamine amidotransferase [Ktedonobacter robiniae]
MDSRIVHLFVCDGLSDWEIGYVLPMLNNPAIGYSVRTVGVSREPVRTAGGLAILPDLQLAELEPAQSAMLILPGSGAWEQSGYPEAIDKARKFLAADVPVAAICGATAGLALAGLLDDRPHTSNAREYLQALDYRGEAFYQEQPVVTDGNLITASATASLAFAYHILQKLQAYSPRVLEAWYGLFTSGDKAYFYAWQQAAAEENAGV